VRVAYDYYPFGLTWQNPADFQTPEGIHDHAYQDKEYQWNEFGSGAGLALYDFHARMYDPATATWSVPDPAEQFSNPYLAMGNNPVVGVDPDGRVAGSVLLVGALAGGFTNLLIAYGNGDIDSFRDGLVAFGKGALVGAMVSMTAPSALLAGHSAMSQVILEQMPALGVSVGDWQFSVSPSMVYGTHGAGMGVNMGISYNDGRGFSAGVNLGSTYWTKHQITGKSFLEKRIGGGVFFNGNGAYTTQFYGGGMKQRIGGYQAVIGETVLNYENDWAFSVPGSEKLFGKTIDIPTGDSGDRWRTTGVRISTHDASIGLNFGTGEPDYRTRPEDNGGGIFGTYDETSAGAFRLGAAYIGYRDFRVGFESERVRHAVQNEIIHDRVSKSPWFRVLSDQINPYFLRHTLNPFTTW
ncbi:MAG: polymorphic toxin type 23 domain-containing protein, partial [Pseudomonadota bacterium]